MDQRVHEQQRQQYLAAMGITPWLPVDVLPGAAPSPQWQWLDSNASQNSTTESPPSEALSREPSKSLPPTEAERAGARQATTALQQMLAENESKVEKTTAPQVSPVKPVVAEKPVEPKQEEEAETPRFRLAVLAYEDCLVINELPLDVLQGMTAKHSQLLQRILASIKLGKGEPKSQLLAWPVVNSAHVDQGAAVARAGVNNLVVRLQSDAQVPMLLMGTNSSYFALPDSCQADSAAPLNIAGRWVLPCPSLNELMCIPGLKRPLWHQLLSLRKNLDEAAVG